MDKLGSAASDFMKEMRSGKEFQGLIEGTQNEWVTISSPKEVLRPVVRIQPTEDGEAQEIQICGRVAS